MLAEEHGLKVPVVVRTAKEMDRLADSHPGLKDGVDPRYLHIVFLDKKVKQADVKASIRPGSSPTRSRSTAARST